MKANRIRNGEKFVLESRGGVWQKQGTDPEGQVIARCVFGDKNTFGTDITVDPLTFVYVIFDRQVDKTGLRIAIVDSDSEETVMEIDDASSVQAAAYSAVESLFLRPPRKRKLYEYMTLETILRPDEGILYVMVRKGLPMEKDEGKDDDSDLQGVAGATSAVEA